MARARNIKPALFKNELLGVIDPHITLLFQSLWMLADREGRLEDRPLRIKAETFPYREGLDVNGYLTELQRMGFIIRYSVCGQALIQIVNFKKHQTPHNTEKASELPPVETGVVADGGFPKDPVNSPLLHGQLTKAKRSDSLIPDSLIPDSFNPISDAELLTSEIQIPDSKPNVEQKPLDPKIDEIFAYWQKVMASPKSVLDRNRRGLIECALKNYSAADICKSIRGCSKSPHHMGDNDRKTKYNGLGLILRNAEYIDKFLELDSGEATTANETVEQRNARITAEFLSEPLDDYNTIEMEA
jgi:hypothetical protein